MVTKIQKVFQSLSLNCPTKQPYVEDTQFINGVNIKDIKEYSSTVTEWRFTPRMACVISQAI